LGQPLVLKYLLLDEKVEIDLSWKSNLYFVYFDGFLNYLQDIKYIGGFCGFTKPRHSLLSMIMTDSMYLIDFGW